jgi:hypothetical protein
LCTSFGVLTVLPTVTKKVVGVFVRFRAPLQYRVCLQEVLNTYLSFLDAIAESIVT